MTIVYALPFEPAVRSRSILGLGLQLNNLPRVAVELPAVPGVS